MERAVDEPMRARPGHQVGHPGRSADADTRPSVTRVSGSSRTAVRHLVLLLRTFPPEVTGGVYRPLALVKYASAHGWRVTVLAGRIRQEMTEAGKYLLQRVPVHADVHRPTGVELWPIRRFLPGVDGGPMELLDHFDLGRRVLRDDPADAMIVSGPPFNLFVAGRYLADSFSVPLVLDFRDEWTVQPPAFVRVGRNDRAFEADCLDRADQVIFVADSIRRLYLDEYPSLEPGRCHAIRNGWDPEDMIRSPEEGAPGPNSGLPQGPAVILHAGTVGAHMLPGPFLDSVARILARREDLRQQLRLRFIGRAPKEPLRQYAGFPYQKMIEVLPRYLPKPETIAEMHGAAALLVLNEPKHERVIPGKFYEYLASGRPILVYGDAGDLAVVMRELDAGWMIPIGNESALEQALDRVAQRLPRPGNAQAIEAWLSTHTREAMAERMFAVVDQACRRPKHRAPC